MTRNTYNIYDIEISHAFVRLKMFNRFLEKMLKRYTSNTLCPRGKCTTTLSRVIIVGPEISEKSSKTVKL